MKTIHSDIPIRPPYHTRARRIEAQQFVENVNRATSYPNNHRMTVPTDDEINYVLSHKDIISGQLTGSEDSYNGGRLSPFRGWLILSIGCAFAAVAVLILNPADKWIIALGIMTFPMLLPPVGLVIIVIQQIGAGIFGIGVNSLNYYEENWKFMAQWFALCLLVAVIGGAILSVSGITPAMIEAIP